MTTTDQNVTRAALALLLGVSCMSTATGQVPATETPTSAERVTDAGREADASAAQTSTVTIALIQLLIRQGVLTLEQAQEMLSAAERQAAIERSRLAPVTEDTVRVPYVPASVKDEMREELREEIATQALAERWGVPDAVPAWVERLSIGGDFRLRFQGDFLDSGNFPFQPDVQAINDQGGVVTADGFPFVNWLDDRRRLRYRARVDLGATVSDGVRVHLRLASGGSNSPVSTNDTFGDYLSKNAVWIDQAYLQADLGLGISFLGGRLENPFWSTDLVWDRDISPEGVAFRFQRGDDTTSGIFATLGAFPLKASHRYDDQWLYGGQLGGALQIGAGRLQLGAAVYDFQDVQSLKNPPDGSRLNDYSRPELLGQGNSIFNMRTDGTTTLAGLASEFRLLNINSRFDLALGEGTTVFVEVDYVSNLAMDADDIAALQGEPAFDPGDTGTQIRVGGGHATVTRRHQWDAALAYRKLESDAVIAVFADSDFGAFGGTDLKGTVVEARYGVADNTWIGFKWLSADAIERPQFTSDVLLLDLNARF